MNAISGDRICIINIDLTVRNALRHILLIRLPVIFEACPRPQAFKRISQVIKIKVMELLTFLCLRFAA